MDTGSFMGVKCGWGVLLTTYPLLVLQSWKSRVIPLPTLWATPGSLYLLPPIYKEGDYIHCAVIVSVKGKK